MKAKLSKRPDGLYFLNDEFRNLMYVKLSLKNCQAIEQNSPNEEYVLEVYGEGWDDHLYKGSRKKNEWDVEVEMEKVKDETKIIGSVKGVKGSGHKITTYKSVPKLDADGCLILKKI